MGILDIIRSPSIPMIKVRLPSHALIESMLIDDISFGLCNALASFQRCMMSIFSYMIKDIMEVFIDEFFVYGKTFDQCLENLDRVLQRCLEKDLVFNWEKCHFMVREGIVLGNLVSERGIELKLKL